MMNVQLKGSGYGPLTLIGEGRFSMVYKTKNLQTNEQYAVKVISPNPKIPEPSVALYREIQALSVSSHPNIVKLHEVIQNSPNLSLVMEYLPYNLTQVVQLPYVPESIVKGIMLMLLRGLSHLHELGIIHRDIKPANLLMNNKGVLKICDLGLSRILPEKLIGIGTGSSNITDETHSWTLQVGTSFYRAPELLLGDRGYGEAIDIWSVGCVMAELLNGKPLFPGQGDLEQLGFITNLLGSPDETRWPGFSQLSDFGQIVFKQKEPQDMHKAFPNWSEPAVDLLSKFIVYEPGRRISARDAMNHNWFFCEPVPMIAPFDGNSFNLLEGNYI
ncbi:cyclin-dependent kinase 20 [Histomonas meleagridis]|uniref:cyclin-dependent kinase 20 n=1 Tax=Histomonas meleagridis TaxID=135588 RepID=UPI003559BC0D|nr:cyclin-dependent kinase 20 [Histomonas meleagridis]KAH0805594.1 cyclin-dependent kinase 20 [Histomonas meleagridis]